MTDWPACLSHSVFWASAFNFMTFELPHFITQRRMMLTIKALAEHYGGLEASTPTGR